MADGGWRMWMGKLDAKTVRMGKCGWENADRKVRIERCGWKKSIKKIRQKKL